ncbi:MAG: hypothetical protein M1828_006729 [Chrysothrix sp. TS-e1954]|nr:MAG: hypothetical protein M1828_006729 [Chrysothrix sp. TS-e1954]
MGFYNRSDPRFQRTINQISSNLESANETAQIGLFSFTQNFVKPCLGAAGGCLQQTTDTCFPRRDDRVRRQQGRARGRPELSFDFYDDWEADETDALLSPQNDEFERLLGAGEEVEPGSRSQMSYGTQSAIDATRTRRRGTVLGHSGSRDPTVIPNQSYFGFLQRLPFNMGRRGLRYQPSAADLQERPRPARKQGAAPEAISEGEEEEQQIGGKRHRRKRSDTMHSGQTEESLSSRGDIFPSDEEDDAVPLDDEFAVALDRRNQSGQDDSSSGKTASSKRPSVSRLSSRSHSSKSLAKSLKSKRRSLGGEAVKPNMGELDSPTIDLLQEEQKVPLAAMADLPPQHANTVNLTPPNPETASIEEQLRDTGQSEPADRTSNKAARSDNDDIT